jgi:2-polyprenyl-6-methoxyphenol hydroxylase-like FAD-dependent oxidoreductase
VEDVLIVGGGPAGIFSACELARHGVRARLVDRESESHHQTRATAIEPATLEMFARAGVINKFLRFAVHVAQSRVCGPGLLTVARNSFAGIDCAYEFQCCLPQWRTEEILLAHLERLGGSVERGTIVTSVEQADDHLLVMLERDDSGREIVGARYLIGAGGARSITRSSMREGLEGETYAGRYVVADARLASPVAAGEGTVVVSPKGFVLFGPLPGDRWIIFVDIDEVHAGIADPPTSDTVAALVNERLGTDVGVHDVCWTSHFRMHRRMAPSLADGRRFLIGDAGHLSSPIAGEGLNAALMDAADLAWKLALVLRGRGRPLLLESYAIERRMADQHALTVSDLLHGNVMKLVKASASGLPLTPAPRDTERDLALQRSRAMLDVSYAGSPLIGERLGEGIYRPDGPALGERYPDRIALAGPRHHLLLFAPAPANLTRFRARRDGLVEVVDARTAGLDAARAGVPEGGAVLIRPDGFIGFRAIPADTAGLDAVAAHLATYLIEGGWPLQAGRVCGDPWSSG